MQDEVESDAVLIDDDVNFEQESGDAALPECCNLSDLPKIRERI